MRTIMAKSPLDSSFSSSKRNFQWRKKKEEEKEEAEASLTFNSSCDEEKESAAATAKRKIRAAAVTALRIRSVLTAFAARSRFQSSGLGNRVTGTLFGYRRGHVHFAFQDDLKTGPALLIELATPTTGLVREMASGLVRIALECDRTSEKKNVKLLEEPLWRTYCNGKKYGFAMRRECGPAEWRILKLVGPISMGAGVLPDETGSGSEGDLMYMRAKFERIVGSRDSEAFYMMNPDVYGGPELSIYLLRV